MSKTLGLEDTPFSFKTDADDMVQGEKPKESFASLFQDNKNPSKGISLYKVDNQEDVVEVDYERLMM